MKYYVWNNEKNKKLKNERRLSFEDVVYYIERGNLLEVVEHSDQTKYKGQKLYVININGYVYLIPFIESEKEIFLKTIIPSRRATKKYLEEKNEI